MIQRSLALCLLAAPVLGQANPLATTPPPATPTPTTTVSYLGTVTGYTDRPTWLAAAGGATVLVDFESIANGTVITTDLAPQGIILVEGTSLNESPVGPTEVRVSSSQTLPFPMFVAGTLPSETNFISTRLNPGVYGTGTLTFTFDGPRTAVGGYIADQAPLGNAEIELYDAAGVSLGVFSTAPLTLPNSFYGVTSSIPFVRAEFRAANEDDSWGLDDLEFNGDGGGLNFNIYCDPAVPNSTGASGEINAFGSQTAADNVFGLSASALPPGQFAYFIASRTQGFVSMPAGSQGNLCVVGNVARFNALVGPAVNGFYTIQVDLANVPEPPGFATTIVAGDTFSFQCWYRDVNPGATSNFTSALEITFL